MVMQHVPFYNKTNLVSLLAPFDIPKITTLRNAHSKSKF